MRRARGREASPVSISPNHHRHSHIATAVAQHSHAHLCPGSSDAELTQGGHSGLRHKNADRCRKGRHA
jgi:hypothetical protein